MSHTTGNGRQQHFWLIPYRYRIRPEHNHSERTFVTLQSVSSIQTRCVSSQSFLRQNSHNNNVYSFLLRFYSTNSNTKVDDNDDDDDDDIKFVVSILGPPNAGKSTLFNRLQCKERNKTYRLKGDKRTRGRIAARSTSYGHAIVSPVANTTRDRRECWGRIGGTTFRLMDTAGIDGPRLQTLNRTKRQKQRPQQEFDHRAMEQAMMEQTLEGARQSDLILLLWDAKLGVTQDLVETARWLRKLPQQPNVALLANKLEGDAWLHRSEHSPVLEHLNEAMRLGLGEAIPISALQGDGMADVAILIEQLKAEKRQELLDLEDTDNEDDNNNPDEREKPLQVAIIGRQNVGKSTLVNTLVQTNRVLAGPTPGLTRDAIAVQWKMENGQVVQLVDTAGIRRLTHRMDDAIEDMSVADSLRAIKVAEVVVLMLDAEALFIQRLELALCNAVIEEGRALVIAANKMDLLEMSDEYTPQDFETSVREQVESHIPMLRKTTIVPMSCLTGEGVADLLPTVVDARKRWARTLPTGVLNRWLREVISGTRSLPVVEGVQAKLKYIIQTKGRPPTFMIFTNVNELPEPFLRYLTKHFQDTFELFGMPVRLLVKKSAKKNPYNSSKGKRGGFGLGGRVARMQRRVKGFQEAKKRRRKAG
ncbi:GTP-binding protein EngA [Nitzschia inconspicua]|uniref:GTPase Der n=1 Tax=Nitzschia inconspicua TaxID=303405 RepID=A0A9K3KH75_9STRA|nr:GTP-binding protein EngA [Nitzschia inconspicua]